MVQLGQIGEVGIQDTNVMNLLETVARGKSMICYNPINGIMFGQWIDNKVVSFISSLPLVGNGTTT